MNSLDIIQSVIANHLLQDYVFYLVPHRALINWQQKYIATDEKIEHLSESKILEPIKTFGIKGKDLAELRLPDLDKYTDHNNEIVSISSEIRSPSGELIHMPMMNLHLNEHMTAPQLVAALSSICDQQQAWLVKTDRYYHVYGNFLLSEKEWEDWNIRFLMALILVSPGYIGYSFLRRSNLLRLNRGNTIKTIVPTVVSCTDQPSLERLKQEQEFPKRVRDVIELVRMKHQGQKRKSGEPYIGHLEETAKLAVEITTDLQTRDIKVRTSTTHEDIYIAGYLHDIIEDTSTNYETIAKVAGEKIARWVSVLTEDKRLEKQARLIQYHSHLYTSCLEVRIIKFADILSNIRSIRGSEKSQWLLDWLNKTEKIINNLGEEFYNSWMFTEARDTIERLKHQLASGDMELL